MKNILKISMLIILSTLFVWFLSHKNLINFELIKYALTHNLWIIFGIAFLQIQNYIAMALRYKSILKILKITTDTRNIFAATFLSNGIGQWLPGSLAFIEVIRVGLMNKSNGKNTTTILRADANSAPAQYTQHLAMASLFDRLIGLFLSLFIGTIITLYFILSLKNATTTHHLILTMTLIFNGLMCLLILLLPIFAGSKLMQRFLIKGELFFLKLLFNSVLQNYVRRIFHKLNELIKLFAEHGQNYKLFLAPFGLSLLSVLSFSISLQFASHALGTTLPFFVTLAAVSILSVVAALPISVGGIGLPQLITAILFGAFGANSADAASAQLLQTGVTLITISLCAMYYLPRMIKEMIRPKIA